MRRLRFLIFHLWAILIMTTQTAHGVELVQDYAIKPVPFTQVRFNDTFWTPRLETNRLVTIRYDFQKCEERGSIDNFAVAGKLKAGEFRGNPFDDSDVYKVVEGAAYALATHSDPNLEKYVDGVIAKIAAAQEQDGYLYTVRTIIPVNTPDRASNKRWLNERGDIDGVDSHELYSLGHLYEAATAYYQATGKRELLDVAIKSANLVSQVWGYEPNQLKIPSGHQEIEIGLVKLYRTTGERKYLNLAKFLLDQRGNGHHPLCKMPLTYYADHKPVVEQNEAVGHAVRTAYMLCGMADIAALTGDQAYLKAVDKIWENVVGKKLYLTGGIGGRPDIEGFCANYDLPNRMAYNETCAAIGNALWNYRMFLLHADARYIDVLERTIYNGYLAGVSLSGDRFFYPNPLECDLKYKFNHGSLERQAWFGCSCCPVNVARFMPSIPGYVYAANSNALYINLFAGGEATMKLGDATVKVHQTTRYPWDGQVSIRIDPEQEKEFVIYLRIPGWARNQPVPSDLYRYADGLEPKVGLDINGQIKPIILQKGYVPIKRTWKKGDTINLNMEMPVRMAAACSAVVEDANKVAIERGPLVYCVEGADNNGKVLDKALKRCSRFRTEEHPNLLGGIVVIHIQPIEHGDKLTAIPYYSWAHRGTNEMAVWLPMN
jgi:DUF1680 family protein